MKRGLFVLCMCAICLCGCGDGGKQEHRSSLQYVLVKEEEIPVELQKMIEEKKVTSFRLTYEDQGQLYIAAGYGKCEGGGYSIQIKEATVDDEAVYFKTELVGPKKEKRKKGVTSYPYLVVQTNRQEKPVIF